MRGPIASVIVLLAIGAPGASPTGAHAQAPAEASADAPATVPPATLQCGSALVGSGDTRDQVLAKCGAPLNIERSTALIRSMAWVNGVPVAAGNSMIEVPVELWVYSAGSGQPMRRVRFESGRVVAIELVDKG